MTEPDVRSNDRFAVFVDRAARIMRLLTWTAMFALVCLMLWVVSGMAAGSHPVPVPGTVETAPAGAAGDRQ